MKHSTHSENDLTFTFSDWRSLISAPAASSFDQYQLSSEPNQIATPDTQNFPCYRSIRSKPAVKGDLSGS